MKIGFVRLKAHWCSNLLVYITKLFFYLSSLFSKSSSRSHSKDKITNRPSPPADSKLVTWEDFCSSSFRRITIKTSPPLPIGSSDQSSLWSLSPVPFCKKCFWDLVFSFPFLISNFMSCLGRSHSIDKKAVMLLGRIAWVVYYSRIFNVYHVIQIRYRLDRRRVVAGNRQRSSKWRENTLHDCFDPLHVSFLPQNRSMRRVLGSEHCKQFVQYRQMCVGVSLIKELTSVQLQAEIHIR